jgi:acyl-coenzyme A thioesterase PaaI-like protein
MVTEPGTAEEFDVGAFLQETVPMVRTLNLEYLETTAERAVLRMRDQPAFHNHLGGPHAGAMFTLAESASGAIVFVAFGDQLSRAVPLPVHAEIDFEKVARGTVTATAELGRPVADIIAELDAGQRPEFPVRVRIQREDGAVTGEMTVVWTLRPNN